MDSDTQVQKSVGFVSPAMMSVNKVHLTSFQTAWFYLDRSLVHVSKGK